MLSNALSFLLQTILGLFTLAVLLRFYLQLTNAPFQNPASQAVVALTNFAVKPLRRVIPGWRGLDLSTLLLAFVGQLLLQIGTLWLHDFPLMVAGHIIWVVVLGLAVVGVLKLSIYIFLYAVLMQAILSWVNPHTPITPVLNALTEPLMRPLRKYIPATSGIDLTPLAVFIIAEMLLIVVIAPLEQQFLRMF